MNSPRISLDSLAKNTWSKNDHANAAAVTKFVQLLMNDHDFDAVKREYTEGSYSQHNRSMRDGIDGVIASVKSLTKRFPEFSYDVKYIHVDGEFVTFHSHATLKSAHRGNQKKGLIIFDTWKVVDGKLVEHWDALQPLDVQMRLYLLFTGGSIRNKNGLF